MKLLRELFLDLDSIPRFCFGRHKAANLVDVRRKYLAAEIDEGRLPIFHPIPGFLQIQFKDLVEWYEEFGNQIPRDQRRGVPIKNRREIVLLNQFQAQKKWFAAACVSQAIAIGFLKREACQYCGWDSALAHHRDYNLPMKVVWLCPRCHALEHSRLRQSDESASPQLELFFKYFLPSGSLYQQLMKANP
jgi:ribosomal protein S27AE